MITVNEPFIIALTIHNTAVLFQYDGHASV